MKEIAVRNFCLEGFVFSIAIIVTLLASNLCFASFKLESTGIILEEKERRVGFNIMNTSQNPIILVTKLENLDGGDFSKNILISPPIIRIGADQSQHINFVLKKDVKLDSEVFLRASFEGVEQKVSQSATMPIRQDIGLLIVPASGNQTREPWTKLRITNVGSKIVMENQSMSVIRLGPQIKLMPNQDIYTLERLFILPGEIKEISVQNRVSFVEITPLSRYGLKLPNAVINVN